MNEIRINTDKPYSIFSEPGLTGSAGKLLAAPLRGARKLCLVCDSNVSGLYGGESMTLQRSLRSAGFHVYPFVFPSGESGKSIGTLEKLLNFLGDSGFTRSDAIAAFGGGVTGDLAGFAASVFMRGIRWVQIPTTLLAAADSSVGGKTAVNLSAGKNLAGTFYQPSLVIFDPELLVTLPKQEFLSGLAEIIKTRFISGSMGCIDPIGRIETIGVTESMDEAALIRAVNEAVEVKKVIVEKDERESGLRRLLNLGHTIGHSIEKCSGYFIPHGTAVMTGMYMVSVSADLLEWSSETVSPLIKECIDVYGYPVITEFNADELAAAALSDKKRDGDNITIVFPDRPGHSSMKEIPAAELEDFIRPGLQKVREEYGNKAVTSKA